MSSGATLTLNNFVQTLSGRTLTNAGAATLADAGFYLDLTNGATFNNQLGATLSIQDDSGLRDDTGAVSTINNAGTISKTGGTGTSTFQSGISLVNSGLLEAQTGTLDFNLSGTGSGASSAGEIRALSGAQVQVNGGH